MLAKIGRTVFVTFNHHVNRSVNIYFSENLVTLLMNLCPTRVLKNFDDDQVLCVTHDRISCFLWSRTLELAGLIEVWVARGGGAELPLEFGSVNPIQARGADYAQHTTASPPPPIQKAIYTSDRHHQYKYIKMFTKNLLLIIGQNPILK